MNVEAINPFINAVFDTFFTRVHITPVRESPYLKGNACSQGDVTGVIGFAEKVLNGSMALSFPTTTAVKLYNTAMGKQASRLTREVQDLIGELTNNIAASARTAFAEKDISFHISVPTIVVGKNHAIRHQMNIPVLVVPFKIDEDLFHLEVTFKSCR